MDPRSFIHKFLQEHGRGNGAAPAAAAVDDVGDIGADELLVFAVEGEPPHFFSGILQSLGETLVDFFIVGEGSSIDAGQRYDAGAGERGGVNQVGAAKLAGVIEAVGEHK